MHSFFCDFKNIPDGDKIIIGEPSQVRHIKNVLRLKTQDEIIVVNGKQQRYRCRITSLGKEITLKIMAKLEDGSIKKGPKITVACAIPKKAKFDLIVDMLTQLGVERIIPLISERVIVKLDNTKASLKKSRWEKIAKNAAEQAHRIDLPLIDSPEHIEDVLRNTEGFDLKIIGHLEGERKSLKDIIKNSEFANILILIGPEGDFTPGEVKQALDSGFTQITLGDTVLKVDTAAVAVVSFIRLYAHG